MGKTAIVYHSYSGSTADMASIIKDKLNREGRGREAQVIHAGAGEDLGPFDTVIMGSPIRMGGFSKPVKRFIKRNAGALAAKDVYLYFSMLYVIEDQDVERPDLKLYIDPSLGMRRVPRKKMNFFDRIHTLDLYISNTEKVLGDIHPCSIAFLKGRLELKSIGPLAGVFMRAVTTFTKKEQVGDFLAPESVREWAGIITQAK